MFFRRVVHAPPAGGAAGTSGHDVIVCSDFLVAGLEPRDVTGAVLSLCVKMKPSFGTWIKRSLS